MSNIAIWFLFAVIAFVIAGYLYKRFRRPIPDALKPGKPLPDFSAVDEQGDPVRSTELVGSATVILFVRGNWCPFCTRQVENLTSYYKDIVDLGGKLVLITPQPLETTRRVAEFFEVEFDFWLDESLAVAKQLGLAFDGGVPNDFIKEYGEDTVWPASLVVDAAGIITYTNLSKMLADRPDPRVLLRELKKVSNN